MLQGNFKTIEELDRAYAEHLDSLKVGGFLTPESERDLMGAWAEAALDFQEKQNAPRFDSLS